MTVQAGPRPYLLLQRIPSLAGRCRMHPRTLKAGQEVLRWAQEAGLVTDPAALRRLRAIGGHRLAGRILADAGDDKLVLFARWLTWVALLDDHWDERSRPATLKEVDHTYTRLLQVVEHGREPADATPLEGAFARLWQVTASDMSPAWRERFGAHLSANHQATRWEIHTRRSGRLLAMADYPAHRRATFATFIFDAGEAVLGTELPEALVTEPAWADVADAANDVAVWCNDVLTLDKDRRAADLTNYVLAARQHLGLPEAEAVSWVIDRIAVRMSELAESARALPACYRRLGLSHGTARAAGKVVCAYLTLPHANLEWIGEAGRYRPVRSGAS
ncbi:terpene synthase family protein [Nonomuraea sp. NPDC002799]